MTKRMKVCAVLVAAAGVAYASGDWSSAKSKADEFKSKADDLVRDLPSETKKIVEAACSANDDDRGRSAESAASNARSHVNDKFNDLERLERDAVDKLEHVDDKDHKDEARRLADEVKSRWSKVKDQTNDLRNGSSRAVEYLKKGTDQLHNHSGRCDAKDISMDAGHASGASSPAATPARIIEYSSAKPNAVWQGARSRVALQVAARARDRAKGERRGLRPDEAPDLGALGLREVQARRDPRRLLRAVPRRRL